MKKIIKFIVDFLTFGVFFLLILLILARVKMMVTGKDYFEVSGYSVFSVTTGSMSPAINENDIILVKSKDFYEEDDVVTYYSEGVYITHRVVSVRGHDIVTKGDANRTNDDPITDDCIIGSVIKVFSNAGIWQKVLTTPKIIIMVFVTLILFDLAFSYKGIRMKKNEKIVDKVRDISFEKISKEDDAPKMTKKEINTLKEKTKMVEKGQDVKFDKKEKEFLNYTIRLDLGELQKSIDDNVNGE